LSTQLYRYLIYGAIRQNRCCGSHPKRSTTTRILRARHRTRPTAPIALPKYVSR